MGMSTPAPHPMHGMDAFAPAEIAQLVRTRGVAKARASFVPMFVLGVLAGAFIVLGGTFSTLVATDSGLGYGPTRLLVGVAFSLGLILVVIAGAELFTGNNLIVMAMASGQVTIRQLLRNWGIVLDEGNVGTTALGAATSKAALSFNTAFWRGVLASALVCLAVWIATGGRTVIHKVIAIVPPIAAFVANAFEHSVANMYALALGFLLKEEPAYAQMDTTALTPINAARNLAASTLGNIVGGALLVGVVYWFVYLRPADAKGDP